MNDGTKEDSQHLKICWNPIIWYSVLTVCWLLLSPSNQLHKYSVFA